MDALSEKPRFSDYDIASRGSWRSVAAVLHYRRPAVYIREMSRQTSEQRAVAQEAPPLILKRFAQLIASASKR